MRHFEEGFFHTSAQDTIFSVRTHSCGLQAPGSNLSHRPTNGITHGKAWRHEEPPRNDTKRIAACRLRLLSAPVAGERESSAWRTTGEEALCSTGQGRFRRPCMKHQASSSLTSPCPPECLIQISNCHENVATPQLIGADAKKMFFLVHEGWMRVRARGEIGPAEAREETCQRRPQPTRGARLHGSYCLKETEKKKNEGRSINRPVDDWTSK
jgi:hypothetical protein